jgi:predicted MFS family arabinose efflux permease
VKAVRGWRPLLGAYAAYGLSLALFINYLVASLRDNSGYSASEAAFAFTAFGVGTIAGGPILGPVSDRFGRRAGLVVAFGLMILCSSVIPTGGRPWATLAAAGFGLAFTGVPTGVAATIRDDVDGTAFGSAFGAATLAFGAALMVGPQLGGIVGDITGSFDLVFVLAALTATVGLGLAVAATRDPISTNHR